MTEISTEEKLDTCQYLLNKIDSKLKDSAYITDIFIEAIVFQQKCVSTYEFLLRTLDDFIKKNSSKFSNEYKSDLTALICDTNNMCKTQKDLAVRLFDFSSSITSNSLIYEEMKKENKDNQK